MGVLNVFSEIERSLVVNEGSWNFYLFGLESVLSLVVTKAKHVFFKISQRSQLQAEEKLILKLQHLITIMPEYKYKRVEVKERRLEGIRISMNEANTIRLTDFVFEGRQQSVLYLFRSDCK